ncbi:hypothetical protein K474DRAFT_1599307 [Panus rudis PR-1116 ss-1]|nr:hypothetical protein K474DRAFT_1599307 [Panus rudis PR-1116 ss-1]
MSEYWVSHKKYFCKYCNIYIADDAPSKRQHESGLRHKGNVERFVRGLYKAGEKRKQDLEEEKREMVRVEQAARAAFAQDVSSGLVKPGSSSSSIASSSKTVHAPKPARPSDPYANYTTAESLGITDPEAERQKAEAERRKTEAYVGQWEVVSIIEPTHTEDQSGEADEKPVVGEGGRKREAEAPPVDEEDARQFRLKKKKLDVGLGEIYDPGLIPIKLKTKKEEPSPEAQSSNSTSEPSSSTNGAPLKWSARGWKKPSEQAGSVADSSSRTDNVSADTTPPPAETVKGEPSEVSLDSHASDSGKVGQAQKEETVPKTEPVEPTSTPSTGGLFRKRKTPASTASGRGRRI